MFAVQVTDSTKKPKKLFCLQPTVSLNRSINSENPFVA